jgi:hypothetical protein
VERADARERVLLAVVRDAEVADFRMLHAVKRRAVHEDAASDAGADGHVAADVQPPRGAPAELAERSRVHVGVEDERDAEAAADLAGDVRVRPAGLGVVVITPRTRSTGPNEPIPIASTGPSRSKKATASPIVSAGVVVAMVESARRPSGPVPTAHSHLEPPASMPPRTVKPGSTQRCRLNQAPPGPV